LIPIFKQKYRGIIKATGAHVEDLREDHKPVQFAFRPRRGTTDAMFMLR